MVKDQRDYHAKWIADFRGIIPIKGKGVMDTYWVDESSNTRTAFTVTRQELDDVETA